MTEIQLILLLIAAILGAILSAVLGWAESGADFDRRKFVPSLVRGAIAAVVVLVAADYGDVTITLIIYVGAFLTGMGIDAGLNRLSGALRTKP